MKIGDKVKTTKGCRINGPFYGVIVGYSSWATYKAVKVKKSDGRIVLCLKKNLVLAQ